MADPAQTLITRHAPIDRVFHWVTALAVLLLLASAFLPILGLKFSWVPLHWITGVVLTVAVLFHTVRSTFFRRLRCMLIWPRHLREFAQGKKAAKYTLPQKLMHAVLGFAVLVATVTGVIMLAKVDTPRKRDPYLLDASTWGVVYVLHGASALLILALTMWVRLFLVAAREARLPACHDRRTDDARGSGAIS